jgi:NAD-dependent deacetylase
MPNPAERARDLLRNARNITALTGAGISAESGIPTFRDNNGLWRNFRAEDLATPQAFARDPKFVWEWYDWRRSLIAAAQPNSGHQALAKLNCTIITQNVDGLHDRAGSSPLKLHGDIWTLRCTACNRERIDRAPALPDLPPHCACGAIERPGVVWFGEPLPAEIWSQSEKAALNADVFLVIGTSAQVYPAAGLAHLAKSQGAKLIEINPAETQLSERVDVVWQAPAAEALPWLIANLRLPQH